MKEQDHIKQDTETPVTLGKKFVTTITIDEGAVQKLAIDERKMSIGLALFAGALRNAGYRVREQDGKYYASLLNQKFEW